MHDSELVGLWARHDHEAVAAAVDAVPAAQRSVVQRLALADTRVALGQADTADLHALVAECRDAGRDDLAALAGAVLVDHLLVHADPAAVLLAWQHLSTLPTDPLPDPLVLVARARLRRAMFVAKLLLGPTATAEAEQDYRDCVADFNRAGWHVDRWLTVAAFTVTKVAVSWTATAQEQLTCAEARDRLVALGSPQAAWVRFAVALIALTRGDVEGVAAEVAQLVALRGSRLAFLAVLGRHLDALLRLMLGGPQESVDAAVATLLQGVDDVRREYPVVAGTVLVQGASALADADRGAAGAALLGRLRVQPVVMAHEPHEREVLACRVDLLELAPPRRVEDVERITRRLLAALGELVALEQHAMARSLALRTAGNARRSGEHALAEKLVAWADEAVPDQDGGLGTWEQLWAARAGALPSTEEPSARNALRLLAPSVEVQLDGRARTLAPATARLVAVLAALDRPVSTEQLVDLLWPGLDAVTGRGRLKSAHHRLRTALAPAADGLVTRSGDVWALAPVTASTAATDWSVDLRVFRALAVSAGSDDRLRAVRMVDGVLAQVQFPYDETLAGLRAPLEVTWARLVRELVAAGALPAAEAAERSERVGVVLDG